jgi:hypothetical protein
MAGRAGGGGDLRDAGEELGGRISEEADVERVREPLPGMPVADDDVAEAGLEPCPEPLGQPGEPLGRLVAASAARSRIEEGLSLAAIARTISPLVAGGEAGL